MVTKFLLRSLLQATIAMTPMAGGMGLVVDFVDLRDTLPRSGEWPQRKSAITGQVWHHTASTGTRIEDLNSFHRNARGWNSLSYHFVIDAEGRIYWINDATAHTWHTAGANARNIGVAFIGHLDRHDLTGAQKIAAARLIPWLQDTYGAGRVTLHQQHKATACPGTYGVRFLQPYTTR